MLCDDDRQGQSDNSIQVVTRNRLLCINWNDDRYYPSGWINDCMLPEGWIGQLTWRNKICPQHFWGLDEYSLYKRNISTTINIEDSIILSSQLPTIFMTSFVHSFKIYHHLFSGYFSTFPLFSLPTFIIFYI